jgi:ABC-type microcin C transport system duplicated ATPase subunit YejF
MNGAADTGKGRTILEIDDLSVSFGEGDREVRAVRNISFTIGQGETVALVGESGSGKSVTALSLMQLLPYPLARHPTGSIRFEGEEIINGNITPGARRPHRHHLSGADDVAQSAAFD